MTFMHVEQTDKGQILAVPVRSGRSHVDLERGLHSLGVRAHVTAPDKEGQMFVQAAVDRVNRENAAHIRGVLWENCEVMEGT